ncbi:unnamed protein product [Microthlaspi erraticum]|uniref:Uncharacterized protein n=1 Tax=Microthlaspi erraticum TaxID=1685480 RepID=A0A6D2KZX8_9BRAS|nr:unnamed protein product [Microthlaspi erraticum]
MKWYIQGLVFGYLSAPQRTGRLGRGLERETAIRSTPSTGFLAAHSIELALGLDRVVPRVALFFLKPAPVQDLAKKNHKNKRKAGVGSSRGVMISSVGVIPRYGLHLCPFHCEFLPLLIEQSEGPIG